MFTVIGQVVVNLWWCVSYVFITIGWGLIAVCIIRGIIQRIEAIRILPSLFEWHRKTRIERCVNPELTIKHVYQYYNIALRYIKSGGWLVVKDQYSTWEKSHDCDKTTKS